MNQKAIQDYYPENVAKCYGCGPLNEHGLKIKSFVDGDETVCLYQPKDYHKAFEGFVYGGLIASIIDCHSLATAVASSAKESGISMEDEPKFGFVTGSLHVNYLNPTPTGKELEFRSKVTMSNDKKVVVETSLVVDGTTCATGEVSAIKLPYSIIASMT